MKKSLIFGLFLGAFSITASADVIESIGGEIVSRENGNKIVSQCATPTVSRCTEFKLFLVDKDNKLLQTLTKDKTLAVSKFKADVKADVKKDIKVNNELNDEVLKDAAGESVVKRLNDSKMKPVARHALMPLAIGAEVIHLGSLLVLDVTALGQEGIFAIARHADRIFVTAKVKRALNLLVKSDDKRIKLTGEHFNQLVDALK